MMELYQFVGDNSHHQVVRRRVFLYPCPADPHQIGVPYYLD